ncbi:MAG: carboxypeptidase-like regulatory domain-containing protein [Bacteroidales bacterium]
MKTIGKIFIAALVAISINAQANVDGDIKNDVNSANSATLTINGQVVDKVTGESLAGVAVKVNNTTTYTDFDGNFSATILNEKTVSINANLISYNPQEVKVDTNTSQNIKVELNPVKN